MAGNSKRKRKAGRRAPTYVAPGALPIVFRGAEDGMRDIKLIAHQELLEIREGRSTDESWNVLRSRITWAIHLVSIVPGMNPDPRPTLNAALDAVNAGQLLDVVAEAITLADDMQDVTTRREHRDALMLLLRGARHAA
jgi:hypothetical protein